MDSGELDFYQHTKVCSNTCRSTKIDLTGARVSLTSQTSTEYIPLTPASADGMCSHSSPSAGAVTHQSTRMPRNQAPCGCPISDSVQGQVGQHLEQPAPVEGVPAHGWEVQMSNYFRSLPTHTIV